MPGGEYLSLEHFKNPVALGQVGDPNMMVAGPSRYDSGFVIPDYDPSDPNYQYEVLNKLKAENQGFGMELATAGANLVPNIALSMVENAGYLFDLEDWSNMIQGNKANYGNALTEWANSNKNQFGEVYQKTPGENDISDSAWWVSNGGSLVESLVAFGITGYGVGSLFSKGASALTKALGAYGKTAKAAQGVAQLGTSLTLAYSEGAMTGAQVFKDVYADSYNRKYQENLALGMGDNEAKTRAHYDATDIAGESATKAVRINTGINTFLNIPETGVLFRSMSSSRYIDDALKLQRGEFARDAVERLKTFDVTKHLTRQAVKTWGKQTGSEMLEEMVNVYAEQEGRNVGREATGQDIMTLGDMLADDDIWAAGFWGAVGGSVNGFVMGQMPKWVTQEDGTQKRTTVGAYNKEQIKDKYKEQLTDLQDRLTEFIDARDALETASKSGDERAYKEAADKVFSYNSFNSIVKGTEEQLLNDYENILSLTPEEATQQGFASDYKQRAAEKIQSVKQNTAEWNKIQDRHASQDLDQAGFPETIFQQHINVQNNRKIIEENTLELAKLEAEIAQINTLRGTDLTVTAFNDVESSIKAVEHAFEMATIDLENILNLDKFDSRTQKRIVAKLSNMYGNITNARTQIEEHLNELREKREDLDNSLEIQKANFYSFIDPDNTMSDQEKFDKYRDVVVQNSIDIDALAEGKKTLEENRKILASQIEELRVLKSDKGLERFKQLKKEKMAEREALDAEAAIKAREQAEAKAEADRIAAINNKKKVAPEEVTPEEEEIIQTAAPVESFEEGNYSGEGSSLKELEKQYDDISDEANNSDVDGEVRDSSDNLISVGDRLISGSNKLAYASTVEYTEDASGIKHISLKLNPETNPNLLTDAYVPGTKLKIKKLTASEFKPFVAEKEISFIDEVGRRILVANAGTTVTFEMLSHPYMQPIGIYNEAGEYQAMLHAVSYITPNRIVPENVDVDLQTLINIRAAVTDQFQDITINSKSNGKINQLPKFYTLSELIDQPVEFAIATSSIQLNTSKTTPVENLANKKGYKVGQVYAITVMPDGRKVAIPVKTTKIKETPQVVTELMSALDIFLKGGTRQDLQNVFGQYLNSVFSSDKLTEDGNSFQEDPNGKDRFYIDFTSTNVDGVIFGRSGGSKYFISSKTKDSDLEKFRNELASIIQESYININFETLKNPDFVKKYVTSNVRFYPLPNGKVTVFDNPVIGFDTSTLISATALSAKVTPAPVVTPITAIFSETNTEERRIEEIKNDIAVLRAKEQAEYAAMSDPNDTAAKDKIYKEYDKLITPLINKAEADIERRKQENLKNTGDAFDYISSTPREDGKFNAFYTKTKEAKVFDTYEQGVAWIESKYKEESDAVKQVKPTTTPISDIEAKKAELEAAIKKQEEDLIKITIGTPVGGIEGIKVGSRVTSGINADIIDEFDKDFDPDIAENDGDGYSIVTRIQEYGESKDGKLTKRPKLFVITFNNKTDADAYIEKRKTKVEEYESKLGTGRGIDRIKEELVALEQPTSTDIKVKKADIERRRQEELDSVKIDTSDFIVNKNRPIAPDVITEPIQANRSILGALNNDFSEKRINEYEALIKKSQTSDKQKSLILTELEKIKINARYDTELARELYKEMKAGKIVTEFTPAEQQILYNPTILTQELKDSVDAELSTLTQSTTNDRIDVERKKRVGDMVIDYVWKRLAEQGITNADPIIGTRDTIDNVDFDKFWSNVLPEDLQNLIKFFEEQKKQQLQSFEKYQGAFDPTTGTFTSDDTSFYDNKIADVKAELASVDKTIIQYGDYTIFKGEDGTYDVQHNEGDGIVGEYLSTKEEAIAVADKHKKQLENKPTETINLTSASGIGFEIEELDEDDYSVTTAKDLGVKPGVQELFDSNPELANAVYEAVGVDISQLKEDVNVTNAFLTARQHEEAKRINSGEFDDTKLDLKTELQNIIDNSTNPLLVELAKSIKNKESLKTIKAYSTQKPFKTKEGFEPAAAYQAETQRLVLFLGNTARFENKEREYQYLLHELVHHFVDRELVLTNSKQAENIRQLFKYTKYQLTKAGKENLYGLTNFHEFVTEALTNPDFQKELKSLQVPDQFLAKSFSIFDYFLELISKVLGTNKSVLEAVVSQAADIFELQEYKKSLSITPQQKQQALQLYSQYLDSVFPDSQVKDIVYHGTPEGQFENFDITKAGRVTGNSTKGIYFADSKKTADFYAEGSIDFSQFESLEEYEAVKKAKTFSAVLNAKNLKLVNNPQAQEKQGDAILRTKEKLSDKGFIGEIDYAHQFIVFEPEQIHILGSKQDIDGFKEFAKSGKQIEKSVSLQGKINTLIEEGKATKFCK